MKMESLQTKSGAQNLLEFCRTLSLGIVPVAVIDYAKWSLLDSLGCALFGAQQPWGKIMAEEMLAESANGRSSIIGHGKCVTAPAAALCNGTAIHGFELDDLLDEAIVHPGAVIVPSALAAAESVNASGSRLLLGIIAGYEAINRVGLALGDVPAKRGHHMTGVAGPIGAAVAAGVVMGLDQTQLSAAVGLACSTSSATKSFAAGSGGGMMKRMHAGRAAESGVRMCQLAARGFTAPPTALDGRFGLLEVFSGEGAKPKHLISKLGEDWALQRVWVKVYPCCGWIQSTVQQLLVLRGTRPLEPDRVRKVRIGVCAHAVRNNGNIAPPDTMGAQYSLPYCTALALTGDPSDPAMFAPDAIPDAARRALASRVELVVDPEMEADYPVHYSSRVTLELVEGGPRASMVRDPHGAPADPCTDVERVEKFRRLASRVKSSSDIDVMLEKVRSSEKLQSVHDLTALVRT